MDDDQLMNASDAVKHDAYVNEKLGSESDLPD